MSVVRVAVLVAVLATGCSSTTSEQPVADETPVQTSDAGSPPATPSSEPGDAAPSESISEAPTESAEPEPAELRRLRVEIIGERPHDPGAFTQGLVLHGGDLYESTGRDTRLRRLDPATGDVLAQVDIDDAYFGEGLELVGDRFVQLTWQSGVAFVYEASTLDEVGRFAYEGEGWGLCRLDDGRLVMSDGTSRLTFRDAVTFDVLDSVEVTLEGQPVSRLNELECVGETIWANVWKTNSIVGIDPSTGEVTALVDASILDELDPASEAAQVLNGIAYDPAADSFLLTGKEWSTLFEVRFVALG